MRCENCGVEVNSSFSFAIKNNQCPACGKHIMQQAKLASYISLRTLLENNVEGIDHESVASLIVANFDLKQLFKEELKKSDRGGIMEVTEEKTEQEPPSQEEEDPDAEYKARQKTEAKAILQKMRDEALSGALSERYGFEDEGSMPLDFGDGDNVFDMTDEAKREKSRIAIQTGAGGSFSRSG